MLDTLIDCMKRSRRFLYLQSQMQQDERCNAEFATNISTMDNTPRLFSTIIPRIFAVHSQSRCYSRYPKYFVSPLNTLEDIEEALKDKKRVVHNYPLKAAHSSTIFSVFFDRTVHDLSSFIMRKGNRNLADRLVNETFTKIKEIQLQKFYDAKPEYRKDIDLDPVSLYKKALANCTPILTTKKVKKSGTWYNVPCNVTPGKANFLAMKYLIQATMEKHRYQRFTTVLAKEIIEAADNEGKAVQMKIDLHKYCESNRAYAHYRWV